MTNLTLSLAGAALAAAAFASAPAAAQVAGIATTSPEIVIARAAARNTAYQQIGTQYAAQITQIGTLRTEAQTLIKSLDTNNDNQVSDAERAAKPAVITQIQLVQSGLLARVADDAPEDAPNFFFIGILPDQVEPFRALLAAQGAADGHRLVPIVQARLARVDGREVADMSFESESDERTVTREFAVTWLDAMPAGNEVIAGRWWTPEEAARESWVSVSDNLSQRLELEIGDEVVFDIQGVRVATQVQSVRSVDWGQLQTNFVFILTAKALTGAPASWAATARSRPGPEGRRALQSAVIAAMPNVTAIDAAEVIERVQALVDRIAGVIRFMAGASILSGLVILAGSIAATRFRRVREAAILKSLGATRDVLLRSLAIEYVALGLVAGVVGTAVGGALAYAVLTLVLGIPWHAPAAVLIGLPLATAILTVLVGVGALLGVIAEKPLAVLRSE